MTSQPLEPEHVVILPYYCREEVARFLAIATALRRFSRPRSRLRFLLAASPKAEPSAELFAAFDSLAPTISFQCPTRIFGYPQGPTAMFWDCMEYVGAHFATRPGFSLWFESDMAIVKPDWLDRLSNEWESASPRPLMMGCFVPDVYRWRVFKGRKHLLHAHINGGACYAKDFARRMPSEARDGVFDMAVYRHVAQVGGAQRTSQICFSTVNRARRDVLDPGKVILHGFMQDKDQFIARCTAPISPREQSVRVFHPLINRFENWQRRVRVFFVRRGPQAMFENMLLAQERGKRRAA